MSGSNSDIDEVLELLRDHNEPVPVPLELPDEDRLVEIEEELLLPIPREMRGFLLEASETWPSVWHWVRDVWLES
ncbi:MAG: hypothetical protein K0Q78_2002 [Cellvibrio sp.]|nr:hypothetical protein [Cellvibrio sp.]